jgi:hypothetical protein
MKQCNYILSIINPITGIKEYKYINSHIVLNKDNTCLYFKKKLFGKFPKWVTKIVPFNSKLDKKYKRSITYLEIFCKDCKYFHEKNVYWPIDSLCR